MRQTGAGKLDMWGHLQWSTSVVQEINLAVTRSWFLIFLPPVCLCYSDVVDVKTLYRYVNKDNAMFWIYVYRWYSLKSNSRVVDCHKLSLAKSMFQYWLLCIYYIKILAILKCIIPSKSHTLSFWLPYILIINTTGWTL